MTEASGARERDELQRTIDTLRRRLEIGDFSPVAEGDLITANDLRSLLDLIEALTAPPSAGAGEGDKRYNAGVITALMNELIGPVERDRLAKTPWARLLVNDLIRRIANLRAALAAAPAPSPRQGMTREAVECLAERHVGAWLRESDPNLQIVPTAARQDIRDFADAVLALLNPPDAAGSGGERP